MPSRQRSRVFAAIGATVLPLVALGVFTVWHRLGEDERAITAGRVQLARAAALATEAFIGGHLSAARALALHPLLGVARSSPELDGLFKAATQANPEWEGLGVVGPDGHSVANSGGRSVFLGDRPYFKEAVASGRAVVSSAIIGRLSGKTTVILAVPFEM